MDFTHFNKNGRARMVDVSNKEITLRTAEAQGTIKLKPATVELIQSGGVEKGDVLSVAQVGGIMGAKKTAELIPMCHNIFISACDISFKIGPDNITALATVKTTAPTGVEMEALTAVTTALLVIYDMVKAVDKNMELTDIVLIKKTK